jgi:hypothetical protein
MIISRSRKFVFVHIEKCGGTSVESALSPYLSWDDMILGSTQFGEKIQAFYFNAYGIDNVKQNMLWKHSTIKNIYNNVGHDISDYKKIAVVRNPIDLVKSLYTFSELVIQLHVGRLRPENWIEISNNFPYTEPYVQAYACSQFNNSGFDGFVHELFKENHQVISPQINRLSLSPLDVKSDLIIDIKDLDKRWPEVLNFIGIEDSVSLGKMNRSKNLLTGEISPKTENIIRNHFAADYEYLQVIANTRWN